MREGQLQQVPTASWSEVRKSRRSMWSTLRLRVHRPFRLLLEQTHTQRTHMISTVHRAMTTHDEPAHFLTQCSAQSYPCNGVRARRPRRKFKTINLDQLSAALESVREAEEASAADHRALDVGTSERTASAKGLVGRGFASQRDWFGVGTCSSRQRRSCTSSACCGRSDTCHRDEMPWNTQFDCRVPTNVEAGVLGI